MTIYTHQAWDSQAGKEEPQMSEHLKGELMSIMLKMCDISNLCRPWKIAVKWSMMISEEFFHQGDIEVALGLPVTKVRGMVKTFSYSNQEIVRCA